ncbi:CBM96 family carbohydrate-binding protein [Bythopirellula polymerisocia]|uniref:Carbohydrate-binding module family 96 domain-containing protein n=1 Tax=Bythopirellula polymerisocia TaxID=2528003 RepID=A0A5C6CRN7_9BACT|nr:DNRLRE domain-containing protein [Bythopirellula polymerisocia]TWU27583.1 hypothetical protein Pla144_23600 [Bythopirellula polymerisocia]
MHFSWSRNVGLAVLLAGGSLPCAAVEIVISPEVFGRTPSLVGYNCAHFMPGSNTAAWWRYSGTNGARVWCSSDDFEGADDNDIWGDGVTSSKSFLKHRRLLRADPLNEEFINWPKLNEKMERTTTSGNRVKLKYAFDFFKESGITPLVVIQRDEVKYPWHAASIPSGWADRWEYWQHYYAHAFYLARHFGIERFIMYNEPDHGSHKISQQDYLARLQMASDAVQSAIQDVNKIYGKNLESQMQAPVTAGGSKEVTPSPGGDPRDDRVGWGELIATHQHDSLLGSNAPDEDSNFTLFQTYAYQQYNKSGPDFRKDLAFIRTLVEDNGGESDLKYAITEFNVHTARVWSQMPETLDTPAKVARFGSILANLTRSEPDELYVFKFSQTANLSQGKSASNVKKNGVHFVDNMDAPYNIGGLTRGGEVVRLFARGFAGGHDLLQVTHQTDPSKDLHTCAVYNRRKNRYFFFAANESNSAVDLQLDLSRLGVNAGATVIVEEVSEDRRGEVQRVIESVDSNLVSISQPQQSVILVSIPVEGPLAATKLSATDDATVKSGSNATRNYSRSSNLWAKGEPNNANARNAFFIKFDLGNQDPRNIEQAILRVFGKNTGSEEQVVAHVYGLLEDDWDEENINWHNAPNLGESTGVMDDISDNFVLDIGKSTSFVGHLTGRKENSEMLLNVTPFVRDHPDQQVTFLIVREVRFDGENVDDDLAALKLASKERDKTAKGESLGPQLCLYGK